MITIEQMIQREIQCCMSSLISTLAAGYGASMGLGQPARELESLTEQAFELASPILDYEEAATQAGWSHCGVEFGTQNVYRDATDGQTYACTDWQDLCAEFDIDPYEHEVFEHWAVSNWLAEKLEAQGEKVDTDFAGLNVWARTTTGQQIAADRVIQRIFDAMVLA